MPSLVRMFMKKKLLTLVCSAMAIGVIVVIAATWQGNSLSPVVTENTTPSIPSRMLKLGPVVDGMVSTKTTGNMTIKMEAARVWLKKTKLFGFDNGLFKKMVAKDFCLTIFKDGEKLLSIGKDRLEMPPDQGLIDIKNPRILFPADMQQPDSIQFDNREMVLYLRTGDEETVWDLENM